MTYRERVAIGLLPRIVWAYLNLVTITSRVDVHGSEHPDQLIRSGRAFIYAFWHNRQIILPVIRRREPIHCLISSSRDGEYVARVAALFGKSAIRGSTTRGGYEAMLEMMRVLRAGGIVALTPDGPLGPPGTVKPGVIQISRALACPIVPIAFDASRKKVFASWDGFNLPYPFSRIAIEFGPAVSISEAETIESGCARLGSALDQVTRQAAARIASSQGNS